MYYILDLCGFDPPPFKVSSIANYALIAAVYLACSYILCKEVNKTFYFEGSG